MHGEIYRQLIHLCAGLILALIGFLSIQLLIIVCVSALALYAVALSFHRITVFALRFERKDAPFIGKGVVMMLIGAISTAIFFPGQVVPSLLVLGVSDALSTIVGLYGKRRLYVGSRKTVLGTSTFFFSSASILFFFSSYFIGIALLATLIESISYEKNGLLDDNIVIPLIVGTALFLTTVF